MFRLMNAAMESDAGFEGGAVRGLDLLLGHQLENHLHHAGTSQACPWFGRRHGNVQHLECSRILLQQTTG